MFWAFALLGGAGGAGGKRRAWRGPDALLAGDPPTDRDGVGFAAVARPGAEGGGRLYLFGGVGPASPGGMADLFRFDQASLTWTGLGALSKGAPPPPRYNLQMEAVNGSLIVFGGYGVTGPLYFLNDAHRFDTASLQWTSLAATAAQGNALPVPRNNFGAAALHGNFFVFGGRGVPSPTSSPRGRFNDLYRLDLISLEWMELIGDGTGDIPAHRSAMGFTAADSFLVLFGGAGDAGPFNDLYKVDPDTGTWSRIQGTGTVPDARYGHRIVHYNGSIYVFGGQTFTRFYNDMHRFDLTSLVWIQIIQHGMIPSPRSYYGFTLSPLGFALFGGYFSANGNVFMRDMYLFKPGQSTWANLTGALMGSKPSARINHGFTATPDGTLYTFGGMQAAGSGNPAGYLNDLYRLVPRELEWSKPNFTGIPPSPRSAMGFSYANERLFVFGGINATGALLNDLHFFDLRYGSWDDIIANNGLAPCPRSDFGFTTVGNLIYVFGGRGSQRFLNDLHFLDPINGCTWVQVNSTRAPSPRASFGFTAADGYIFIFGGQDSSGNLLNDLYKFDPLVADWVLFEGNALLGVPMPRSSLGFSSIGKFLFVFGGQTMEGPCSIPADFFTIYNSELHRFDLEKHQWTELTLATAGPGPAGRCGLGFAAAAGKLLAFGGCTNNLQNDIWEIHPPAAMPWASEAKDDFFIDVYDWDSIFVLPGTSNILSIGIHLCTGLFPCRLSMQGSGLSTIFRSREGTITCYVRLGCMGIQMANISILCQSPGINTLIVIDGETKLNILHSSFASCVSATDGGVIKATGGVSVVVIESEFSGTYSFGSGGAIAVSGGQLKIDRTIFYNCSSMSTGYGGAVVVESAISLISTSWFTKCTSMRGGGAIVINGGASDLNELHIQECKSGGDGGGIMIYGGSVINITKSLFLDLFGAGYGGGITVVGGHLRVINSRFVSCSSTRGGGAVFAGQFDCYGPSDVFRTSLKIESSDFYSCKSTDSGSGGAILISSERVAADLSDSNFSACYSRKSGGAISVENRADAWIYHLVFINNSAEERGGAVSADKLATFAIIASLFIRNTAQDSGGALSSVDSISIVNSSTFSENMAHGRGGGAVYNWNGQLSLKNSTATGNSAAAGGGGVLFWEGNQEPKVTSDLTGGEVFESAPLDIMCGKNNVALYGPCFASACKTLYVSGMPTATSPAFPGMTFTVLVVKKDRYNQTIITDSSSVILTHAARYDSKQEMESLVSISGKSISQLLRGQAELSLIVKPTYSVVIWNQSTGAGLVELANQPSIYFYGTDMETVLPMESEILPVIFANGSSVCPSGYVLDLVTDKSSIFKIGECTECLFGTYSVNPLAGSTLNKPSCLNCPAGAVCSGRNSIVFRLGVWTVLNGMYKLISCPPGHQLLNSIGSSFAHDIQQCLACQSDQYIINSNDSMYSCRTCPAGAVCNGSSLIGRVTGSVWTIDVVSGTYVLLGCPAGYELLSSIQDCSLCPPGYYCLGGSVTSTQCPEGTFAPAGSNSSLSCLQVVFVTLILSLPVTREKFVQSHKAFQEAIAATAKLSTEKVWIQSVSRRQVNSSSAITIITKLPAADIDEAFGIRSNLNTASLKIQLSARGLPDVELRSVSVAGTLGIQQNSDLPMAVTIGICFAAIFSFLCLLVGTYYTYLEVRKQTIHRIFRHAFLTAKTGSKATEQHLPYKLREKYYAEKILGKGACGCVVRVRSKKGNRLSAIKIIVPEKETFDERKTSQLLREAHVLELLTLQKSQHAVHLAGIDAIHMKQNICWFIMELLEGENLDDVIKTSQPGSINDFECIKVARNVLAALKIMHAQGLIHRDIKPANIMRCVRSNRPNSKYELETGLVGASFVYKLIDFGSAVGLDNDMSMEAMISLCQEPFGVGTPPYMSPEMHKTPHLARFPTDLWSLGVTLFELGSGTLPFEADSSYLWSIVIAGDLDEKAPNILDRLDEQRRSRFDNNLAKVVAKALEKRVENRYSSVDEMHEALYSCLISRGEAVYSVFISYRVVSEAPLARILFDVLNHTVTPGGHRVTVYWDAHRLVNGEDWEEGFAKGLLNSLCVFPLLSYGSTAPLAQLREDRIAEGWEETPVGRPRLQGSDSDIEDNFLKELLISCFLFERRSAPNRASNEGGILQLIYPILVGRQHPEGHPQYPRMGDFFHVSGGGGNFAPLPSPPTNKAVMTFLRDQAGAPEQALEAICDRSVASVMHSVTSFQGCKLWSHPPDLYGAELSKEQHDLVGRGYVGPPVDLDGVGLTEKQKIQCGKGFDKQQLGMLKAQVLSRLSDFHEVIDRAVAARARAAREADGNSRGSRPPRLCSLAGMMGITQGDLAF